MNEAKFKFGDRVLYHGEPCKITCVGSYINQQKDYAEHKYDIVDDYGVKTCCVFEEMLTSYIECGNKVIKVSNEPFYHLEYGDNARAYKKGDLVRVIKGNMTGMIGTVDKFFDIQKADACGTAAVNYFSIAIDGISGARFLVRQDEVELILKVEDKKG